MPAWVEIAVPVILCRNHPRLNRPTNAKLRIIPADSALACRIVKLIHQVKRFRIGLERDEPVAKAFGHIHHLAILGRERFAEPLAERRRAGPQIEDAIPQSAADTTYDF